MMKLMAVKSGRFQLFVFPHAKKPQFDWSVRVMASSLLRLGAK
jgi:hypothetical protein